MIMRECFPCKEEKVQIDMENVKYIYEKIGDDYSREIFANRFMYSLVGDYGYIGKILSKTEMGRKIVNMKNVYIYGAGKRGTMLMEWFPELDCKGFIDKKGTGTCMGYPVYEPEAFEYAQGTTILISIAKMGDEVCDYLLEHKKIPRENIFILDEYITHISDDIYFESKYINNIDMTQKIFMDLGSYDGKDSIRALNYFKDDDISVYALEPDEINYKKCKHNLEKYAGKVYLIQKGIGYEKVIARFQEGAETASKFDETGNSLVEMDTIDGIVEERDVGFIKMDIEGQELDAIVGGAKTIRRCNPVLAVSIYHKKSDIYSIPLKILEINPSYQFYFEHYSFGWYDTVLYAVAK